METVSILTIRRKSADFKKIEYVALAARQDGDDEGVGISKDYIDRSDRLRRLYVREYSGVGRILLCSDGRRVHFVKIKALECKDSLPEGDCCFTITRVKGKNAGMILMYVPDASTEFPPKDTMNKIMSEMKDAKTKVSFEGKTLSFVMYHLARRGVCLSIDFVKELPIKYGATVFSFFDGDKVKPVYCENHYGHAIMMPMIYSNNGGDENGGE